MNIGGYDYVQLLTIEHMKRFVKENGNGLSMKVISGKTWSVDVISWQIQLGTTREFTLFIIKSMGKNREMY